MIAVVDRVVQYANRYKLTDVSTGTVLGIFDFEAETGTVQTVGTEINKELFDSIASDIAAKLTANGGDTKDCIITFGEAQTVENINSGESHSTIFGKIKKWFTDRISGLKAFAYNANTKIAKTDLDSSVQTSLGKADTALQEHQDISGKVDKVAGKGLSTEDYTTSEKTKLANLPTDAVRYGSQSLTDAQKAQARSNIGAGTSNFSGAYNDLTGRPTIPDELADLASDSTHRTVTDTEKSTWNAKQNALASQTAYSAKGTTTKVPQITTNTLGQVTNIEEKNIAFPVTSVNGRTGAVTDLADAKDYFTYYATCATGAMERAKVATIQDATNFSLRKGIIVGVKYTNTNTYSATENAPVTLNIGGTGAKNIYFNNTATPTGTNTTAFGAAGRIMYYMYDGSYWVFLSWSGDNNTTYSNMSTAELLAGTATNQRTMRADYTKPAIEALSTHYGTCSTAAATAQKEVSIADTNWKLRVGALITVKFTYTNTATTTYLRVNSDNTTKGRIWYNTAVADSWAAGYAGRNTTYMWDGTYWVLVAKGTDDNSTGYLSYTATSVGNTDTNTQYLIGKRTVASNGTNYYNSSIYFKGYNLYSYNVYATSDRRLKENIKDAELDCGAVIDKLPIKEFNFKSDEDKKVVVGAIAQELMEILPEKYRATLVSGSEDTSYSINEGKLLYVAIGALKDEMKKTKDLEARLEKLEKLLGV